MYRLEAVHHEVQYLVYRIETVQHQVQGSNMRNGPIILIVNTRRHKCQL